MPGNKVANYFNERGEKYSNTWAPEAKRRLSEMELDLIRREIESLQNKSKGKKIKSLDIGIGTGRISEAILKYDVEHYGTDISQTMVGICKRKFSNSAKIKELAVHDIYNPIPESWGKFDFVTAMRVLSYTKSWPEMLQNIYEAMNPGGVLIFTFPNAYSLMAVTRLKWKKKSELGSQSLSRRELTSAIEKAGFSKYKISGMNKLFDTFYDLCKGKISSNILLGVEKLLKILLGQKLLTREFYVACIK